MSIKLVEIVTAMKSKWTYGTKSFGYTEEFNDNHNTQYPSLLITPPTSVFPEIFSQNGWENYTFEVYFSNLYNRTEQSNESIEERWQNLQDLGMEWLDMFLKHYQANPTNYNPTPVVAFLEDSSLSLERIKEAANDQLLQIKMTFTWRVMSMCFNPVSAYPPEISGADLKGWLRADSNVLFSIPTKKINTIGDSSGNSNGLSQSVASAQPLRYSYGGLSNKAMTTFTTNSLVSVNNFTTTSTTTQGFTIFEVSKIKAVSNAVFGYFNLANGSYIEMGTNATGNYKVSVSDGTTILATQSAENAVDKYHIGCLRKQGNLIYLNYKSATSTSSLSNTNAAFNLNISFESEKFRIGCTQQSDGGIPTPSAVDVRYLDGDWQELIIYDKYLSNNDREKVNNYLNNKYKIY